MNKTPMPLDFAAIAAAIQRRTPNEPVVFDGLAAFVKRCPDWVRLFEAVPAEQLVRFLLPEQGPGTVHLSTAQAIILAQFGIEGPIRVEPVDLVRARSLPLDCDVRVSLDGIVYVRPFEPEATGLTVPDDVLADALFSTCGWERWEAMSKPETMSGAKGLVLNERGGEQVPDDHRSRVLAAMRAGLPRDETYEAERQAIDAAERDDSIAVVELDPADENLKAWFGEYVERHGLGALTRKGFVQPDQLDWLTVEHLLAVVLVGGRVLASWPHRGIPACMTYVPALITKSDGSNGLVWIDDAGRVVRLGTAQGA